MISTLKVNQSIFRLGEAAYALKMGPQILKKICKTNVMKKSKTKLAPLCFSLQNENSDDKLKLKKKGVEKHPDFKLPSKDNVGGRVTTINSSFFKSITPVLVPTQMDVKNALEVLGMETGNVVCAYCGDPMAHWDHFMAIVKDGLPSGYITELANLVPCCGVCNQSKGNTPWSTWIVGTAPNCPLGRGKHTDERVKRLMLYEKTYKKHQLDYKSIVGKELWGKYISARDEINKKLTLAKNLAKEIRVKTDAELLRRGEGPAVVEIVALDLIGNPLEDGRSEPELLSRAGDVLAKPID